MNLNRIRDLAIAKTKYSFLSNIKENINYLQWVEYIDNHLDYFIWAEDTEEGKKTLANIDKVPDWARERVLTGLKKQGCYAEFDNKKGYYNIVVNNYDQKIGISFERFPNKDDLRRYLDMANYLDAYLLKDGTEIIDEKVIENLDNKKLMTRKELIKLGRQILKYNDVKYYDKLSAMIEQFNENVPHPDGARLLIYPENYNPKTDNLSTYKPTVEEVVDKALSYKPV